jgi:uncharacterized protein with HEPN domain
VPRDVSPKDARGWEARLDDMVAAVRRILDYVTDLTFEQFSADRRTVDAVLHNFAVLGEAARHVPPDVESAREEVPWSEMRLMRNVAVHVYHGIKLPTLWETIQNDLPPLLPLLEELQSGAKRHLSSEE